MAAPSPTGNIVPVLAEWRSAFERFELDIVAATAEEDRVVFEFTVAAGAQALRHITVMSALRSTSERRPASCHGVIDIGGAAFSTTTAARHHHNLAATSGGLRRYGPRSGNASQTIRLVDTRRL
jgi:hypothetical protein